MPAPVIRFSTAVAARRDDADIAVALFNGGETACVAILLCSEEAARALIATLGSVLETPKK
jgi:hypothetical protein